MIEKISKDDWQYFVPFFACTICFIATDFLGIIDKTYIAYWSGRLFYEPYRLITSHFFHGDLNHLLANVSGIIVARYFLKSLGLKSDYFFLAFVALIMLPLLIGLDVCFMSHTGLLHPIFFMVMLIIYWQISLESS